jgi:hypothetical protein
MVNRPVIAAALGGSVAACAWMAGCDALIGLGPEATLHDEDTGVPTQGGDSGAPVDGGGDTNSNDSNSNALDSATPAPDAPEGGLTCGLPPAPNATCNGCSNQHCCAETMACAMSSRCATGSVQLQDCVYDPTCVAQVDNENADTGLTQLQTCVLTYCVKYCFPKTTCSALARCCKEIPPGAARETCVGAVNTLDETNCESILVNLLRPEIDSGFCPGAGDLDGGGD